MYILQKGYSISQIELYYFVHQLMGRGGVAADPPAGKKIKFFFSKLKIMLRIF